jgi:anthranilate phosphoribosyltransferase
VKTDQLLYGVARPDIDTTIRVLREFGYKNAMVCNATDDGIHYVDEFGLFGRNHFIEMQKGAIGGLQEFDPSTLGMARASIGTIQQAATRGENVRLSLDVLRGEGDVVREDIICIGAGVIMCIAHLVKDIPDGFRRAKQLIRSGAAYERLQLVVRASGGHFAPLQP